MHVNASGFGRRSVDRYAAGRQTFQRLAHKLYLLDVQSQPQKSREVRLVDQLGYGVGDGVPLTYRLERRVIGDETQVVQETIRVAGEHEGKMRWNCPWLGLVRCFGELVGAVVVNVL